MRLTLETGTLLPHSPTPLTGREPVTKKRKSRSTFPRRRTPSPSVCSRNCIRRTSSSDFRATVSTSWKGSDATAPLLEDTIGRVLTPSRAPRRGDTAGVPHLLHALHQEDIAAGEPI